MGRGKGNRRAGALEEISALRGKRRVDIIKCAFAIAAVILVITGKPYLETVGILPADSMLVSALMFLGAVVLAVFAGSASTDYAKSGRRIEELCAERGITKEDIRAYERP